VVLDARAIVRATNWARFTPDPAASDNLPLMQGSVSLPALLATCRDGGHNGLLGAEYTAS
jgi:hypothetical protein